jgi:hypothetical protein
VVRTGSELLELFPATPLSAVLVGRPARLCVFVPAVEGLAWERLVEHALAVQTRFWGGGANLVVPTGWDVAEDEVFWRLIDRFDPDVVGIHVPTYADVEELAPERYAAAVENVKGQLTELGFEADRGAAEIAGLGDQWFWEDWQLPENLPGRLLRRIAPLWVGDEPRTVYLNGTQAIQSPLTDVVSFRELPEAVADVSTTLGDREQLELTHAVGRLLPSLKSDLAAREVEMPASVISDDAVLAQRIWPLGGRRRDLSDPLALAERGLVWRLSLADRGQVVVVVGDEPRDFLLFHGLTRLRPYVYWLPAARLGREPSIRALGDAARRTAQSAFGGNLIALTTATNPGAAEAAVEALNALPGHGVPRAEQVDWTRVIPRSALWVADARSERRVALLSHEGETQELSTPVPVSISSENPFDVRWMVDVEIRDWTPARHPAAGTAVLRGPLVDPHDVRASRRGPSYFGLSPLTQAFLGLEGSTARPRVAPLALVEQIRSILKPSGWEVSLSDKGAFASQSTRLFGGVAACAAALRDPAIRALLAAYLTPTETNEPGKFLRDTRRRYLTVRDAEGVVEEAAATLVATLYDSGVLLRGHLLKCEHCRVTSFDVLSEDQRFTCRRCLIDSAQHRSAGSAQRNRCSTTP